jgi:hypothetical protein
MSFAVAKYARSGRASWCKSCMREYHREYRQRRIREQGPSAIKQLTYAEKVKRYGRERILDTKRKHYSSHREVWRAYTRYRKYGLTSEQFDELLARQKSACAVCRQQFSDELKPCVDHDKYTGMVRGLLCDRCNVGIGCLKHDRQVLQGAMAYLWQAERLSEQARSAGCDSPTLQENQLQEVSGND